MIARTARPRLAPKVRLRFDRASSRYLLLYPEKGMQLNGTAADVVQLCTGEHTVEEIIDRLAAKYTPQPRERIDAEVIRFLEQLSERALLSDEHEQPDAR
jgi:pyrroloquinoline quinone biosynthesis protein D